MGADAFRQGLRDYLRRYAFANATWTDLIDILDARTPSDLVAWSHAWVDEPGRPVIHTEAQITKGRVERLVMRQEDPHGRGLLWPQTLDIAIGGTETSRIPIAIVAAETPVPAAEGTNAPKWILPIGGYGLFDLDAATLEYLSRSLGDVADPYARGTALVELWEEMLEGNVAPGRLLDDLLLALPRETDELLIQQMLEDVRVAYWRFTAADDRPAIAEKIETILKAGLERASSTSQRAAWFDAFRRVVTTQEGIAWLTSVWRRDVKIPGLPLAENDEADVAAELALRDVPEASALLQEQLDRFQNADRKARFAFLLPALSSDATMREAFFESLKDVRNRQHEAWVLDGARYLHHPLRAAGSKKYLKDALGLTREIQQTGDIFFPKRWADASLSGYQSVQTAAEVRTFINHLPPDYPPRLRWVLLSAADPLFRAARLFSQ
jgi:aminopeptidase N